LCVVLGGMGGCRLEKEQEELTKARVTKPIDASNKGSQMLAAMGWSGQGLGRDSKGITAPLSTKVFNERAGLGAAGAASSLENAREPSEDYRSFARKRARERFEDERGPAPDSRRRGDSAQSDYLAMIEKYQNSLCGADDGDRHRPMLK
jgi:hypothetical protein